MSGRGEERDREESGLFEEGQDDTSKIFLPDRLHEEVEALRRENEKLAASARSLERDQAARVTELEDELAVQKTAVEESHKELERLRTELEKANEASRGLKSQNLDLQYHLNSWGIPVSNNPEGEREILDRNQKGLHRFFPPVTPLDPGADPVPIVLRGDLSIFSLTSLLGFLESSNLVGVLTVVSEETVTKLYLEGGSLHLAAWNNRDVTFSLPTLLVESELLEEDEAAVYRDENLYDLEVANRLVYEGKLDYETVRECLREHTRVIITQLFEVRSGSFFFQQGRPSSGKDLQFKLSVTDLLLRTAAHVDEETRNLPDLKALEDELTEELEEELGV